MQKISKFRPLALPQLVLWMNWMKLFGFYYIIIT